MSSLRDRLRREGSEVLKEEQLKEKREIEERIAARVAEVEAQRVIVQHVQDEIAPIGELLAQRKADLAAIQAEAQGVSLDIEPIELAAILGNVAALEQIISRVQAEFQRLDAEREKQQLKLARLEQVLKSAKKDLGFVDKRLEILAQLRQKGTHNAADLNRDLPWVVPNPSAEENKIF